MTTPPERPAGIVFVTVLQAVWILIVVGHLRGAFQ
jgi:hypothetical protein